jgi:CheY-like chemotaxis protein
LGVNKHILVVEDNAAARDALAALLGAAGYSVACAANGREALDHLRGPHRPFLILLDLSMPVMDGWEFRARQRQSPSLASIPVILLSAEDDLPRLATSLGVASYFPKPVRPDGLLRAIRVLGAGQTSSLAAG